MKEQTVKETTEKVDKIKKYFAFYRNQRRENFSDSEVVYEVPLTEELFDIKMDLLSTKKMQGSFENFVVAVSKRLITPNIKPQTGPDGGGDGKVDAETFVVSPDVSDKWYVSDGGARGEEKWAFAVSCKKQWKTKAESDVKKIVETGRGYTQALFFTNQYVKGDKRLELEKSLSEQHGLKVSIFDRSWLRQAVFQDGCRDIALSELDFSDDYKKKHITVGPNDKRRQDRLEEIEKGIVRSVEGLDTQYVDELHEAFILSRNLERPRPETERRYMRAFAESETHGTEPQRFNLIYDHGWTSFFWFEDVAAAYKDYLKLKEYVEKDCTVVRLEKLTNLKTVLVSAQTMGVISMPEIMNEVEYVRQLESKLATDPKKHACHLFLRLHIVEQDIIYRVKMQATLVEQIADLRSLLFEAASCIEISLESQFEVMGILANSIGDCPEFDKLLDELSEKLSGNKQAVVAAKFRLDRAQHYLEKGCPKEAVRHLGFCVYAFEKEECTDELITSSGLMGVALWEMGLPYSAEAFLLKAACFLMRDFYKSGDVPHLLVTVLQKLCEIEVMLGRLVMYLNWNYLLMAVSSNAQFYTDQNVGNSAKMQDASWACRFAAADLTQPIFAKLPDILDRAGMFVSSEFLKYTLGHPGDLGEQGREAARMRDWRKWMLEQPVFDQFMCDLNISQCGNAHLETTVNNFTFKIDYPNVGEIQRAVEVLLASVEAMMATDDSIELAAYHSEILIRVVATDGESEMKALERRDQYEFSINIQTFKDDVFWKCVLSFMAYFFSRNTVLREDTITHINRKQEQERMVDRVSVLQHTRMAIGMAFGDRFRHRIEDWVEASDKIYKFQGESFEPPRKVYKNRLQLTVDAMRVNRDMDVWEGAGWKACFFLIEPAKPPILGLAFEDPARASSIVEEWKKLAAEGTPSVKILIIRGINEQHPTWYRVCVAPDGMLEAEHHGRRMLSMCRKLTMTPENTRNLDFFARMYKQFGCCRLMSVCFKGMTSVGMPEICSTGFMFSNVVIMNAYEVDHGTEAVFAMEANDHPVIPVDHKTDAPVLSVLEELKKLGQ